MEILFLYIFFCGDFIHFSFCKRRKKNSRDIVPFKVELDYRGTILIYLLQKQK